MKTKVHFEWCVEVFDENNDIIDCEYDDSLNNVINYVSDTQMFRFALVMNVVHPVRGMIDRDYAYCDGFQLPDVFPDSNVKIPTRFHNELKTKFV